MCGNGWSDWYAPYPHDDVTNPIGPKLEKKKWSGEAVGILEHNMPGLLSEKHMNPA